MSTKEYLFDAKCFVVRRITASSEREARDILADELEQEGYYTDGEADLIEIDGEEI